MRGQNALNVLLDMASLNGMDPDRAADGEVGACGLSLACLHDVQTAFGKIIPDAVSFHINCGCSGLSVAALFFAWLKKRNVQPETVPVQRLVGQSMVMPGSARAHAAG